MAMLPVWLCELVTKGKHKWETVSARGGLEQCYLCGKSRTIKPDVPAPKPDVIPKPDSGSDQDEKPETTHGDPPDARQPQLSPPHWDVSRATAQKLNHWNQLTSRGTAKILLSNKYLNRTCWATLQDASGHRETMRHASPSDAGARPRYYATKAGKDYVAPVKVIVQTLDGDFVYTINNPANKGG